MVKQVSFTTGATPAAPQISPLVAALLKQSLDTSQIRSPVQGLDKLGKAALAAFLKRKDEEAAETKQDEAEAKQAALVQNLLGAFSAQQGTPGQTIPAEVASRSPDVPARSELNIPGTPGDPNAIARALIGGGQIPAGLDIFREDAAQREALAKETRGREATIEAASTLAGVNAATREDTQAFQTETAGTLAEALAVENKAGRDARAALQAGQQDFTLGRDQSQADTASSVEELKRASEITDKAILADAVKANQDANRSLTASESTKAQEAAADLANNRPVTVSPGQVVTRGGKVIFEAKDKDVRVKLSPGDRLLSGTGAVIAIAPSSPKPPATRTIKRGPDFITQEFNEKTNKYEDVETAPRFGRTAEDLEELVPLEPLAPSDTSGAGDVDVSEATGGSGLIKGIGNTITDAFGVGLASPQTEIATNALNTLALQTTLILSNEITGRPSKFIQEKILAIQASAGSIFQGDERSKIKFQEVRDIVADQRNDVAALIGLKGLKRPDQAKAIVKLRKLDRLLTEYDNILENFGKGDNAPTQEDLEFTAREEGISVDEVKRQLGLQ